MNSTGIGRVGAGPFSKSELRELRLRVIRGEDLPCDVALSLIEELEESYVWEYQEGIFYRGDALDAARAQLEEES